MDEISSSKLRAYLLGQLSGDDRDMLEEKLFADPGMQSLVESVEHDLYDDFASGALSPSDRGAWRQYMASHPDSAVRLRTARALQQRAAKSGRTPPVSWIVAAAAIAAALLVAFFYFTPKPKPVYYASASLEPGTLRSGDSNATRIQWLDLPAEATGAQIELRNVPNDATQAFLRQVDSGQVVWRGPISLSVVLVPATAFQPGDYVLTITDAGGAEIADYSFRVRKPGA
ncbi:hypothetical protein F183_A30840 [Bryobacterales bacterium F-183]|nr:hypothetical protein F183_A30840 [Bryobacterales bacterium F-183]